MGKLQEIRETQLVRKQLQVFQLEWVVVGWWGWGHR